MTKRHLSFFQDVFNFFPKFIYYYNMFISFVTHLPFLILNTYFVYIKNTLRSYSFLNAPFRAACLKLSHTTVYAVFIGTEICRASFFRYR